LFLLALLLSSAVFVASLLNAAGVATVIFDVMRNNLWLSADGGGEEGQYRPGVLQHHQLHRIYWTILCTAIYPTVCRSTAQQTVYLHRQELSVIDGRFCS